MNNSDQSHEHTASYYAATVNTVTDYAPLRGAQTADICVVGGGFTGVSAALTLAERGYNVAVLEANRIGWGASGRNGGQLIHGMSGLAKLKKRYGERVAGSLQHLEWRGNDLIRERVARYDIHCDLKDGYVEVAPKARQVRYFDDYAAERESHNCGHRFEVWDRDKTRDMLGTDAYHGGFVCYRDGHLHPLNLCIGEAQAAESLGTRIYEKSKVIDIVHGGRPRVVTDNGHIDAQAVLLAGNAYHRLERRHLSSLTFPAGSYIVATEPLPESLAHSINKPDVAVCDVNEVVDYHRLSADRRLLYGGACNYSGRDPKNIQAYIVPRMLKVYPQLKDVSIEFEWGGKIAIVPNRVPTIGRVRDNVYYCQGYSGHGVCATHVMSEIVADAMAGTMEQFDLFADYGHWRIPGGQWFGNQLVALGMLYYKIKDRL